jgi:hypothetical protein
MNKYLKIAVLAALISIIVVIVLKLMGQSNAVVTGGAVAGAIVGAITSGLNKKKE